MKEIHTISDAWVEALQDNIKDVKTTQADHSEHFDKIEVGIAGLKATQNEHSTLLRDQGQKLDLILQLLQKSGE